MMEMPIRLMIVSAVPERNSIGSTTNSRPEAIHNP